MKETIKLELKIISLKKELRRVNKIKKEQYLQIIELTRNTDELKANLDFENERVEKFRKRNRYLERKNTELNNKIRLIEEQNAKVSINTHKKDKEA